MKKIVLIFLLASLSKILLAQPRKIESFNNNWKFYLGNDSSAIIPGYNDTQWRTLNLPHDWSIEGDFSKDNPTTFNQGALPAGIGWYRKTFTLPVSSKGKEIYIQFDGIHRNSSVWINGHFVGNRPNGYVSFRYDLTAYIKFGETNVIAAKVDDSAQPNSRWYTGSGIYRNTYLITTNKVAVDDEETFVTTQMVKKDIADVAISLKVKGNHATKEKVTLQAFVYNADGMPVSTTIKPGILLSDSINSISISATVDKPILWSVSDPYLYRVITKVISEKTKQVLDETKNTFGIRTFRFDAEKGFFLNDKPLKILGVCEHHDLGALGAAVNTRAIERKLEILKAMGVNAIRTAHNPPAPEFLDLCDKMGFLVMDEAFDMWNKRKNKQDYHNDFAEWHKRDLEAMVKRDRNHPSVIIWSIGNEIREQFDSTGTTIARELVNIVKNLDTTRPVTSALTENIPSKNFIYQSHALDVLGFNYKLDDYPELPKRFPGEKFIATETSSALATRGHYDMPSDSNRLWPPDSKSEFTGNPDHTVSAYDNVYAYWGSTHEDGWNAVKKYDFMSGIFVWSGFDFIGEPVPYKWPSRSSYYGVIDLAGFPKDTYYMYQSEWTKKPVLHLFPHWNWEPGKLVDVWAYYNNADEVELFLNGKSLGTKKKEGDKLHVMWRVPFEPGTLKAVSRKNGKAVLIKEIKTAGKPAKIELIADRKTIKADGKDLSFVTINVLDKDGNPVPNADNLIHFEITGPGSIAAVDNGNPASHEPFQTNHRKAFNGKCLVIVQTKDRPGNIILSATAPGLMQASTFIKTISTF